MAIRVEAVLGADVGGYVNGMSRASAASRAFAQAANSASGSAAGGFQNLQSSVRSIETTLNRFKTNTMRAFAAIGAGQMLPSIFSAAKSALIDFNQQLDQSRIAFTTFMGSADKANDMLLKLQQFAAKTPFNFKDLLGTTQQMIAMGTAAEDLIPRLTAIGDAAAALGGSPEVMRRIQRALGQIQAKGRVQAEELMQLAEVGIPAYQYIADVLGVTIPQSLKMMERGQVSAAQAITGLLDGMGRDFGGMMDKHSQTMMGALSTVQDYVSITVANMSRPLFEAVRGMMRSVAEYLGSEEMTQKAKNFAQAAQDAFKRAGEAAIAIWEQIQPVLKSVFNTTLSIGRFLANGWKSAKPAIMGVIASIIGVAKVIKPVIDGIGMLAEKLKSSKAAGVAAATAIMMKFTPLGGMIKKIQEEVIKLSAQRATGDVFKAQLEGQNALRTTNAQTAESFRQTGNAAIFMGQQTSIGAAIGGRAMATMRAVVTSLKASLIGLAAGIPIVLALTAVTSLIQAMGKAQREAKARTKEMTDALNEQVKAVFATKEAFEAFVSEGADAWELLTNAIAEGSGDVANKLTTAFAVFGQKFDSRNLVELATNFEEVATQMLVAQGVSEDLARVMAHEINISDENASSIMYVANASTELTASQEELYQALESIQDQYENDALLKVLKEQQNFIISTGLLSAAQRDEANALAATAVGYATMTPLQQEALKYEHLLAAATANKIRLDKEALDLEQQKAYTKARLEAEAFAVMDLNQQYDSLAASQTDGALSFEEFNAAVFSSLDTTRNWVKATREARDGVDSMVDGLLDATDKTEALQSAGYDLDDALRNIYYQGKQQKRSMQDIAIAMNMVVASFVAGADEADITDGQIQGVIESLQILNMIGDVGINIFTNAADVVRELDLLSQAIMAVGIAGGDTSGMAAYQKQLKAILDEIERQDSRVRGRSRGGGGGAADTDRAFEELKDYVQAVEDWVSTFFERDFAKNLVAKNSEDVADAIAEMLDRGIELAIDKLPGAAEAFSKINEQVAKLVGQQTELRGPGGLQDQLNEITQTASSLKNEIKSLTDRLAEFRRVEMGIGEATTVQKLDEQLEKYRTLKQELTNIVGEYDRFKTGGKTALQTQVELLGSLEQKVQSLVDGLAEINAKAAGPSPLEQEVQNLNDLSSALDNASRSRADFAASTAESLAAYEKGGRGGSLFLAKRYLGKLQGFSSIISQLRDKAFPPEMVRDVIAAGIDDGTVIGRKLLALSDADLAEFRQITSEINRLAAETGAVAADVLFTADVNDADAAFRNQLSLVQQMYANAIAEAQGQFDQQRAIVDGVYQAQIAEAQKALDLQKKVVEGLFEQALAEFQAELGKVEEKRVALISAIDALNQSMLDVATEIARLVGELAGRPEQGGGGGGTPAGFLAPSQGAEFVESQIGNFFRQPGMDWTLVHRTPLGDYLETAPGVFQGVDLRGLAEGGRVSANEMVVVGEAGPELFMPNRGGMVVPNDALAMAGGSNTYNITVNARGDATEVGRQVVRAIQEYERRNGTGWRA